MGDSEKEPCTASGYAAVPAVLKGRSSLRPKTRGNLVEWYNTGCAMNKAAESCKIVIDDDGRIAKLIAGKLEMEEANPENSAALGFLINGKMAGGILYTALKPGNEVWLSIYSDDKRWCTRRVLKIIFGIVF